MGKNGGQVLVGAILLLMIVLIIVPVMVMYVQNEARWSVKQGQNTNAFQLAEAAIDRGYQKVTESTATWKNKQAGQAITGFQFDTAYSELPGGSYAVSITSGPSSGVGSQVVTIIGIGRDALKKEVRALSVVYEHMPMNSSVYSGGAGSFGGTNEVEWGSVISRNAITVAAGTNHPQLYSAGNISGKDANASALPNTDSVQWWSYKSDIPEAPYLDFDAYKSSAIATGTCISESAADQALGCVNRSPSGCGGAWVGGNPGALNVDKHSCTAGNAACKGYTWYVNCPTAGFSITSSDNDYFIGSMIIIGNLTMAASAADGAPIANVPNTAWKQYGNDWAYYLAQFTQEAGCTPNLPAAFPGLTSQYRSPDACTKALNLVLIKGFMYVSGNATFATGGTVRILGSAYIAGTVNVNSGGYIIYFDRASAQALLTTRLVLARTSWQDVMRGWPLP